MQDLQLFLQENVFIDFQNDINGGFYIVTFKCEPQLLYKIKAFLNDFTEQTSYKLEQTLIR